MNFWLGNAPAFSGVKFRVMSLRLGLNYRHIWVPISISFLLRGLTRVTTITLPPWNCTASPAFEEVLLFILVDETWDKVSEPVSKSILRKKKLRFLNYSWETSSGLILVALPDKDFRAEEVKVYNNYQKWGIITYFGCEVVAGAFLASLVVVKGVDVSGGPPPFF